MPDANKQSLLTLIRSAGDANLGQSILRLAALAQATHRYEMTHDRRRANGLAPRPVDQLPPHSTPIGTEADR
jgi:hypothetical protein